MDNSFTYNKAEVQQTPVESYNHNYYIDFLKAYNLFLKNILNVSGMTNPIQKIEYNIGSNTLLKYNLYGNETYEYPNILIDLVDIRVAEGVTNIRNNVYGMLNTNTNAYLADNYSKNQFIYTSTGKYILNFNLIINVETSADLLNYYHLITNNIPINFTFVDFEYFYAIDISEFIKSGQWDFDNDDIFNVFYVPDKTERDKNKYYSFLKVQPELEIQSINKTEDKENSKYQLNISMLASVYFPTFLYGKNFINIDRVICNIDLFDKTEYPIILDTLNVFKNNKIKKGIFFNDDNIKIEEDTDSDPNDVNYIVNIKINTKLYNIDLDNYNFIIEFNNDIINLNPKENYLLTITLDKDENNIHPSNYEIFSDDDKDYTIISIKGTNASLIKEFLDLYKNEENFKKQYSIFLSEK